MHISLSFTADVLCRGMMNNNDVTPPTAAFLLQVHVLHCAVSHGRDWGTADYLCSAAVRAEDRPVLCHSPQQVQLLF